MYKEVNSLRRACTKAVVTTDNMSKRKTRAGKECSFCHEDETIEHAPFLCERNRGVGFERFQGRNP